MPIIYFNGSLGIDSFDIQGQSNGSWAPAKHLLPEQKYRFVVRVLNNSGNPRNFDITNLKLIDLLKPWPTIPTGQEIVFTGIKIQIAPPAGGIGAYQFYSSSTYSGPASPAYGNDPDCNQALDRGEKKTLYAHFIWKRGPIPIAPALPGMYVPQVSVTAKEMRVKWLPAGPRANLQPNT